MQRTDGYQMKLLDKYRMLHEGRGVTYDSGVGYTVRVITKDGKHIAKFFKNGEHMTHADYGPHDKDDVHEFARDEMEHRKKEANESVNERILEPQGHKESADRISDDSEKGKGAKKKMMGNHTPLEIIAKILAGR